MKKVTRRTPKTLKRLTWEALSRFVRARDPQCICCGAPTTDAGHFQYNTERNQSYGGNALWYDLRNIHGQCAKCNRYAAGNLVPYTIYLQKKYGIGIVNELYQLWRTPKKWTHEEIETKRHTFDEAFRTVALRGLGTLTDL